MKSSIALLTRKNLRVLLRSKSSVLIVTFIPLLLILILGLAYNTSGQYGITVGIHAAEFTDDANSFIASLESENFEIIRYETSIETCVDDIKTGSVHTCILLPASLAVEDNSVKDVTFHIDPTRINLVWMIQETVQDKFDLKSQQISEQLTSNILTQLSTTKGTLTAEKEKVVTAKGTTTSASDATASVTSSLTGLDLTPEHGGYDSSTKAAVIAQLEEAQGRMDLAIEMVDGANLSSAERNKIRGHIQSAKKVLAGTNASGANQNLGALVDNLITAFDTTKGKLVAASSAISSSTTSLDGTASSLQESLATLSSVEESLNSVIVNLESQKVTEASTITSPLRTTIEPVREESTYLNYLFPALLIIVMMFSSLLLGTTLVMTEKNSPAFIRNFFLPVKKTDFITSIYLTNAIVIITKIVVLLGIAAFFLDNIGSFPLVALILFIVGSVFTFIGMVIGYVFTSEETSVLASVSLGSLLLFLSGVILPLEAMPAWLRSITAFNPFVLGEKVVREIFFFQAPLTSLWLEFIVLIGYTAVLFFVILAIESIVHKHLVHRFLKHHHKAHRQKDKKHKQGA